ncbi:hypothetical protein BD560DRAFT_487021 [Blakeslea trispora]|nr:hypothetical protein BD560DRAFT_487021 [Blakeslea trispora]
MAVVCPISLLYQTKLMEEEVEENREENLIEEKEEPVVEEDRVCEEEDEMDQSNIWDRWIKFIKKAQTNPDLHEFACERHGVLRLGHGITNANLSDEDYNALKACLLEKNANCIPDVVEGVESHLYELFDITDIQQLWFKIKWPITSSKEAIYLSHMELVQEITASVYNFVYKQNLALSLEQSYRDVSVFPLLKACVNMMDNDSLLFVPGEVPLESMTTQLANSKKVLASNEKYYADGLALFGLLSCMASIAQAYSYASLETFSKLKLYFVQTKGSSIHLWYLRYLQENTYAIVRESKLKFSNEPEKYADTVLECLQFAGLFKGRMSNTMDVINKLTSEHHKTLIMQRTSRITGAESPPQLLSAIVKPAIIKLTESKHSKEMHKLGPDSFF